MILFPSTERKKGDWGKMISEKDAFPKSTKRDKLRHAKGGGKLQRKGGE